MPKMNEQQLDRHLWNLLGRGIVGSKNKNPMTDNRLRNAYKRLMEMIDERQRNNRQR